MLLSILITYFWKPTVRQNYMFLEDSKKTKDPRSKDNGHPGVPSAVNVLERAVLFS